ncbi:hypothetical protein M123_3133 [Bacteroides fragilis str. 3976T8]|uniref:Uncharacterized protein n=2 Tax=Bacteroides fragilis TaxID=817 RepID=A0A016E5J4_BACFG|nr:hypothetical protein M118_2755 [Bacteroides fragilis str. 3783N1-2]EXY50514.1 hypothetical protein M121_2718 [Bacteroides fragilis str. 3783N2-1]EXY55322.1 hypothetical protein M122_2661 [Bacteroides fragilis str. 3976T7]EXZ72436.1 hypothetical protein M123_3133 [Bacteroides fragilis str. 3976T8]EYB08924.1 hypothetical protein M119_3110 [Bacteroides fragilis str. 3783N1-6]
MKIRRLLSTHTVPIGLSFCRVKRSDAGRKVWGNRKDRIEINSH